MPRIISVCNQKGGVGKTTTAINISAYLACSSKKTLLIDIDPQANATSGCGIDRSVIGGSIYDVLLGNKDIKDLMLPTQIEGFSIIPSHPNLTGAEVELISQEQSQMRLKELLLPIKDSFDFIIIDSPPSLGILTVNALVASDSVIIPIQCEYYALEGLTHLLNTIELIKNSLNPSLAIEGILLTMADFRTNLTNEVINEVREFFKGKVYQTVIPRNIRLSEAPSFGKPAVLYDNASLGAQKYLELSREILGVELQNFDVTNLK